MVVSLPHLPKARSVVSLPHFPKALLVVSLPHLPKARSVVSLPHLQKIALGLTPSPRVPHPLTYTMATLSEQDKATLREIVKVNFLSLASINMDYIFSQIEDLLPKSALLITYAKNEDDDEFYEAHEDEIDHLKNEFWSILMCGLYLQHDLSDDYEAVLEKVLKWLKERPVE